LVLAVLLPLYPKVVMHTIQSPAARPVPTDRRLLIEQLEAAHEEGVTYWAEFDTPEFFAPIGAHWSPAEHVRHLTRSMAPLLPALRLPRTLLRILFGAPEHRSRDLASMERVYTDALAAGGTAGRFAPPPDTKVADAVRRNAIMDAHSETLRGLTQAMERWSEAQLDGYRLPHPLLGKLTVREMMVFTLIHNRHHVAVCQQRRGEVGA
jgi:DinB superfamily